MALKALMLRKKIDMRKKELEALKAVDFEAREAELAKAIEETEAEDEQRAVEEEIEKLTAEKTDNETKTSALEAEIRELEAELSAEEAEQAVEPEPIKERSIEKMQTREKFGITEEMMTREEVQDFVLRIRDHISQKRAITNAGLVIPEVFLGILRENVVRYSKLYSHVDVRRIAGEGRLVIQGGNLEAVWTECCANLNDLTILFNDVEVDCNKLGAYVAVCNAILEDSDIDLAATVMEAIAQAIGFALDKAILYGTGTKMPLGVVARLAQESQPAGYPATARTWVDLHTTNIQSIAASVTGTDLFRAIILDSGAMKGAYARGEKTWVMNEGTYTKLMAAAMAIDSAGAIVAGVNGKMPVVGGSIEVLNFVPDDVIIGGYFELYLLAERAGVQISRSEHAQFLADNTVFKGTARYDGTPKIAEAFVAIGINGVTPDATMTFAADTANAEG